MTREEKIESLKKAAPVVTAITTCADTGYEFSAVVPTGVIYAMPGMLIDYSGGKWPPDRWECKTTEEFNRRLHDFLMDATWEVVPWERLSDEDIDHWFQLASQPRGPGAGLGTASSTLNVLPPSISTPPPSALPTSMPPGPNTVV